MRAAVAAAVLVTTVAAQPAATPIPAGAERAYLELKGRVDGGAAMDIVRFMDQYWRISGQSRIQRVGGSDSRRLAIGRPGAARRRVQRHAVADGTTAVGTVSFADTEEVLLSRERDRVSLCINSFSTPAGGIDAPIVDVGAGTSGRLRRKERQGSRRARRPRRSRSCGSRRVKARGAAGVISTSIAPYIRPEDPAQFAFPDQWDVFQWGSVPYDAEVKALRLQGEPARRGKNPRAAEGGTRAREGGRPVLVLRRPEPDGRRRDSGDGRAERADRHGRAHPGAGRE